MTTSPLASFLRLASTGRITHDVDEEPGLDRKTVESTQRPPSRTRAPVQGYRYQLHDTSVANGSNGPAAELDGLSSGAEAAATILQDQESSNSEVVLRLECESEKETKAIIALLRIMVAFAIVVGVLEVCLKTTMSDSSSWVQKRGIAYLNVIVAGFCFLLLTAALYQFLLRLCSVRGSRWSKRRKRLVIIYFSQLVVQAINAVFFLIPNAILISSPCGLFSKFANVANFLRWTCLAILFFQLALSAHSSTPWHRPAKNCGRLSNSGFGDSLLLDAPSLLDGGYRFWPEALLCVLMEAVIITILATAQTLDPGTDCVNYTRSCDAGQSKTLQIESAVLAALHLLFTALTLFYLRRALNALQSHAYSECRFGNIVAHLQARTTILSVVTLFIAAVVLWFSGLHSCSSHLYTWFGLAPVQIVSAGLATVMALFFMPLSSAERATTLKRAQLQTVVWSEPSQQAWDASVPHSSVRSAALFCFETALKAWYWSWLVYAYGEAESTKEELAADEAQAAEEAAPGNDKGPTPRAAINVDMAAQLFGVSAATVQTFRGQQYQSKAVVASSDHGTIVVAFRGTDSVAAAFANAQIWMNRHPMDTLPWWRRVRRVHAGFLKAWYADGFAASVLDRVRQLAADVDPTSLRIVVTGHSLGGAIAVLAAYDIAMQLKPLRLECYTFGAPRIGNRRFTNAVNDLVPHNMNIVNDQDTICWTAKGVFRPYARQGCKVFVNHHGDIIVRPNPLDQRFLLKLYLPGGRIAHHFMGAYLKSLVAVMGSQFGSKQLAGGSEGVAQMLKGSPTLAVMLLENGIDIHATIESSAKSQQALKRPGKANFVEELEKLDV